MAQTFILQNTASDLGGGADFSNQLLETTGADGDIAFSVSAGQTEVSFGFTEPGVPGTDGATGDYTVEVEVEVGNTEMQISIQLHRVNSSGVAQAGSTVSGEQQGTAGIKAFNFTALDLGAWAAGDRLRVAYRFRSTAAHGTTSITIGANTTDQEIVTPFSTTSSQTLTPTAVPAAFSVQTVTLLKGAVIASPDPVAGAWSVQTPAVVKGAVILDPTPVAGAWDVQTPLVVLGGLVIAPDPITGAWSVLDPSLGGAQTASPTPVSMAATVQAHTLLVGGATITPEAVLFQMQTQTPALLLGPFTLTPDPVLAQFSLPSPEILEGPIILSPAAIQAAFGVQAANLLTGPVTLLVDPVQATFTVLVPILEGGEQTEGGSTHRPRHFAMYLGLWGGGTREPQ